MNRRAMRDQSLPAGRFKAICLKLMDEVAASGKGVTITKRGKPVARLVAARKSRPKSLFGALAGRVQIVGDVVGSTGEDHLQPVLNEWDEIEAAYLKGVRVRRGRPPG